MRQLFRILELLLLFMFCGCERVDNNESVLHYAALSDLPLTDCSTSTRPLRNLVLFDLMGVPYKWQEDWMSGTTYIISPDFSAAKQSVSHNDYLERHLCSGTHGAFINLIEGGTDVIVASRDISRNEKAYAEEQGVEIETAPLAIDALVFIVNTKNPVKGLTSEQIRKIYTGEITNWKEVGGVDHTITPYIRDTDSGSQEKMETLVMNGLKMIDGSYMHEIIGSQMASPYLQIESDEYGIGYTPYFYCTSMVRELMKVKVLDIDGVTPDKASLRDNKYPYTSNIYAGMRKTDNNEGKIAELYGFFLSGEGSEKVTESGYIPMAR